jgi:hypothetical protein
MKGFKMLKTCFLFFLILSTFLIIGCGTWYPNAKPTVTLTIPVDGEIAAAINTKITATFSQPMDPSTITTTTFKVMDGTTVVSGMVALDASGLNAVFRPDNDLAINTKYTATITIDAKDINGNALAVNYVWSFHTGAIVDTNAPTVDLTVPANAATDVYTNTKISVVFNKAMDPTTITKTTFTVMNGTTAVSGTVTPAGFNAAFKPDSDLAPNTTYTATITTGVADLAGNALAANYVWTFKTGAGPDTTPPTVTFVTPANLATNVPLNSTIRASFSKTMDFTTFTNLTFTVGGVTGSVVYNPVLNVATFTPDSLLDTGKTYTATITTGVKDLLGNALAVNYVWTFKTALAPGAVALNSASTYGCMATATITNTGPSIIDGDVSLNPGSAITGIDVIDGGPGTVTGGLTHIHINDSVSLQARADLLSAYNYAWLLPAGESTSDLAITALAHGGVIPPGTYTSPATLINSSAVILDGGGNANAVWVFQINTSMTSNTNVTLAPGSGAKPENVFWVPKVSATIGVGTTFNGTIVAGVSATCKTGAIINGRILAGAIGAGAITLDTCAVNVP